MRFRDRSGTTRDSVVRRHFFQAEDSADAMSVSINARPRRVRLNRRLSHLWPSSAIRRLCLGLAGLERGAGRARRDQEQRCKQTERRSHSTMRLPAAPFGKAGPRPVRGNTGRNTPWSASNLRAVRVSRGMTNPTVNGDWSAFGGHSCSPGSCDCDVTTSQTLQRVKSTAKSLDVPLDEGFYPYVPPAFQVRYAASRPTDAAVPVGVVGVRLPRIGGAG